MPLSPALVLRSLKAIRKETTIVPMILGGPTPNPGVGSPVELSGRDARGLLNLIRVGKALSSQRIAAEETPPAFLQIEPAGSFGNEDVMEARMRGQPSTGLSTVVATEIIGNDEDVPRRIVGFNVLEQSDRAAFRCAKRHIGSTPCHRAPVTLHTPRSSQAHGCNPLVL
jgi:hypothetical protein